MVAARFVQKLDCGSGHSTFFTLERPQVSVEISGTIPKRSKTIGNMCIFRLSPPCVFQVEWMMLSTLGTDIERALLKKLIKPKEYGLFRKKGPPRDLNLAVESCALFSKRNGKQSLPDPKYE